MFTKYAFTLLLLCVLNTQCANILGVFNIPSVSHQVVFQPIWKELSLRGHQVTVITPNPLNDPTLTNLTEIDVGGVLYRIIEGTKRSGLARAIDHWAFTRKTNELNVKFTTEIFANEQVQALLANDTKTFDLVMIEPFYYSPAILAAKYNCPLIGVESLNVHTPVHELIGSPIHPLLYPDFATAYGREKTFFQKVDVVLFYFWQKYAHRKNMELIREEIRKHIDENLPDVDEVMKNMSLLFLNTNPILHGSRPYGPNVIEMGGMMHLTPEKPLPSELKEFLDNSSNGVLYFSFGTNIKSTNLEKAKRTILIDAISELPYDVLWKFEDDELEHQPPNVKIGKWFPQRDLLGHPKINLFVSQGGLQSAVESLTNGVPMLVIPFVGDQFLNADQITRLGAGLQLEFKSITKEAFKSSIREIAANKRYKMKAMEIGRLLVDEEKTGLEKAIWWTEYVIRNKGAPQLRSPAVETSWFEFFMTDVIAFLICILTLALYLVYKILWFVLHLTVLSRSRKIKTS